MSRPVMIGAALVILVASVAVGALAGGALAPAPSFTPPPVAQASPTPAPTPTPTPDPTPTPTPSPTPTPTPEPTPVMVPAPLTGRMVTEDVARRHPIAVMIDDLSRARPQSGLNSAAIVWHAPAEGGIPRYMAIFQDQVPAAVGPVRSARHYYVGWAAEWRALYVHAGGSPQALALLRQKGNGQLVYDADEFRYGGSFHRINSRPAPHNLYTDGATLRKLAARVGAEHGPIKAAWRFAPDAPLEARPYGGSITVSYAANTITYNYQRSSNRYLRVVTGEGKQIDAADDERIGPRNVIVMLMKFAPLNDGTNKKRLEATVVGTGTAWISTNGRTIKGTWRKPGLDKPTEFLDADGNEVTLTVGQTFIQVLPTGSTVRIKAGSDEPPPTPTPAPTSSPSGSTAP